MSFWPPLALAVALGVSSVCLAAESHPADQPAAVAPAATDGNRPLSLDVALKALGLDGSAADAARGAARPDLRLATPESERGMRHFALRLGRTARAGRSPGDAPPLYGEVGIDLDPQAGLSLVPSYRLVLDDDDRAETGAIGAQVLKLGARIRF